MITVDGEPTEPTTPLLIDTMGNTTSLLIARAAVTINDALDTDGCYEEDGSVAAPDSERVEALHTSPHHHYNPSAPHLATLARPSAPSWHASATLPRATATRSLRGARGQARRCSVRHRGSNASTCRPRSRTGERKHLRLPPSLHCEECRLLLAWIAT